MLRDQRSGRARRRAHYNPGGRDSPFNMGEIERGGDTGGDTCMREQHSDLAPPMESAAGNSLLTLLSVLVLLDLGAASAWCSTGL